MTLTSAVTQTPQLPPREFHPERRYTLDVFGSYPDTFNSTDVLLDQQVAAGRGDHAAIVHTGGQITYAELAVQVNQLGNEFRRLGLAEGDRVLLRSMNEPAALIANFAALKLGAVVVPTSPLLGPDQLTQVLRDCEPKIIVVNNMLLDAVIAATPHLTAPCHVVVFDADSSRVDAAGGVAFSDLLAAGENTLDPVLRPRSAVSLLFYSSGLTRPFRAAAHLQEEMLIIPDVFGKHAWNIQADDVVAGAGPMCFAGGYSALTTLAYRYGATTAIVPIGIPAAAMFQVIRDQGITLLAAMPTTYQQMADAPNANAPDLASLRIASAGGECLPTTTLQTWRDKFNLDIFEGFGTNAMMHVFLTTAVTKHIKPGAIGTPLPGYEVAVLDGAGEQVAVGVAGQLYVRGPIGALHWGHIDSADAVAALQQETVHDGWTRVGDWVTQDADGAVRFVAREEELIVRGGDSFGPRDVELVLAAHPDVVEAGVYGTTTDGAQRVHALVVLDPTTTGSEERLSQLVNDIADQLTVRAPDDVTPVLQLPRTSFGTLLRRAQWPDGLTGNASSASPINIPQTARTSLS